MEERDKREVAEYNGKQLREREDYLLSTEVQREYDTSIAEELSLRDYIDIILRRKWIIISCLVVSVVTVAIVSSLMTRIYKAEATIEIAPENPKITAFEEVIEVAAKQDEFYATQYELIKSKSLAKEVISVLRLDSHPELAVEEKKHGFIAFMKNIVTEIFSPKEKNWSPQEIKKSQLAREEGLINSFLSSVETLPKKNSRLLGVSFESSDPELSAKAVNTLVDKYIEWILQRKLDATRAARGFLEKQLGEVK
ncbi:MAG TPA: Wzz/FepE/Etk N-terminal domain-containing protein, partial [Thermodesulfobacteriota bacterium]|nr:Wzz/FepE/Etk N-terminal domain-containing protein [Thermodesulfobacteriota bacterium]